MFGEKNKMTTLKQILEKNYKKQNKLNQCNYGFDFELNCVREWLQRKQYVLMPNGVFYNYSTIKELLGELK